MKKLNILLAVIVLLTSCSDFLDIKPKSVDLPNNTVTLRGLLEDDKTNRGYNNLWKYRSDEIDFPSYSSDLNLENANSRFYFMDEEVQLNGEHDGTWEDLWNQISKMNTITDNVKTASGLPNDLKFIELNAIYKRVWFYFELVNMYCKPYNNSVKDAANSGLPYLRSFTITKSLERLTLGETYAEMIKDLEYILDLVGETSTNTEYVNKKSVYGMLAKIYLNMGNYDLAGSYAEKSFNAVNLEDYNSLSETDPVNDRPMNISEYTETIYLKYTYVKGGIELSEINTNDMVLSDKTIAAFSDKDNDLRWLRFVKYSESQEQYKSGNFLKNYSLTGIQVPEMMLIAAECECRNSDGVYSKAIGWVNAIREKRFITGSSYSVSATNKAEALAIVMAEKTRELYHTDSRFRDIRRLNAIENAGITMSRTSRDGTTVVTLSANDARWTMPINPIIRETSPEFIIE